MVYKCFTGVPLPHTYTVVLPEEADHRTGKVSVLAPVGSSMFGFRRGRILAECNRKTDVYSYGSDPALWITLYLFYQHARSKTLDKLFSGLFFICMVLIFLL
jgi:hypothetical protein